MTNTTKLQDEWVDIIIPTFDNLRQLRQCIGSMRMTRNNYSMKFIIVNNGKAPLHDMLEEDGIKVVTPPTNLGWTGGLNMAWNIQIQSMSFLLMMIYMYL